MTAKDYHAQQAGACYARNGYVCVVCGKSAEGLAHMIPQRKTELDKYGWWLVHSEHNMLPTCHKHNDAVQIPSCEWDSHAVNVAQSIRLEAFDDAD